MDVLASISLSLASFIAKKISANLRVNPWPKILLSLCPLCLCGEIFCISRSSRALVSLARACLEGARL